MTARPKCDLSLLRSGDILHTLNVFLTDLGLRQQLHASVWDFCLGGVMIKCRTAFRAFNSPLSERQEAIHLQRLTCRACVRALLCVSCGPLQSEDCTAATQEKTNLTN